jgi:uncharacterized RDD family membrane protein YckC
MTHEGVTPGTGIITGDAVVVELRYAKLPSRSLAFGIDLSIQIGALLLLMLLFGVLSGFTDAVMFYVVVFVVTIGIFVGYPVTCETLTRGRTVGKIAVGLRVVRDDGGAIRFRHALVRGLLAVVEVYLFLAVSVITSLLSPEGKRLGDYLAGTVVLRERAPRQPNHHDLPAWMPPELSAWAASLDLSRLDPATAMSVGQYLSRRPTLAYDARVRIGSALQAEVAQQVSPSPPLPVPPEVYLGAVLAERRRRAVVAATRDAPTPSGPRIEPAHPAQVAQPQPSPRPEPSPEQTTGDGFAAPH